MVYGLLFRSRWRPALLGFAYLKLLDDAVDEEPDAVRALATLSAQRRLLAESYADWPPDEEQPSLDHYGHAFYDWDREHGARLRPWVEALFETFAFDVERRGQLLSRRELDAYAVKGAGAMIRYLAELVSSGLEPAESLVERASLAYVWADALIDLEHDLGLGVINVPREDVERFGIDLGKRDEALRGWIAVRAAEVESHFAHALRQGRRVPSLALMVLGALFLRRKRRSFRRFLEREAIRPASDAPP